MRRGPAETLGPIICAACGAKVREDRARCLRCGAALQVQAPAPRLSTTSLAIAAGVVALGGFAALMVVRPSPAPAAAALESPEPTIAAAPPAAAVETTGTSTGTTAAPAPAFRSMEVSRAGLAAYSRGDIAGSVEQFQAAVATDPQNAEALNNLGQVLVRSGKAREALPYFDRAIAIADGVWAFRFNRARALGELQEWPAAISGYRAAAQLFPDDYATQFNLAKALQANGELNAAVAAYEQAIVLAPGQTDFHLSHGLALEAVQRPRDAAAAYRRYLELEEAPPEAEKIKARIAQLEEQAKIAS